MRIGIDARLWGESGVGRYTRNLVLQLQKIDKKNEYVLFVLEKDYQEIRFKIQDSRFKIQKANIRWHTIEEQIKLLSILNREKLDLVHFPYFSVPIFYQKAFVVTIHDLILHHFPTGQSSTLPLPLYWLKIFGYRFIMQQATRKAKKIITVSYATKDEIVDHLHVVKDKVVVTYEGVDNKITNLKSSFFAKASADKQNTKYKILNTKYFLYVGNAYPHKNLERLIEAFSLFCHPERSEGSHDIRLVLVGKEDFFYKRLKEKVRKMELEDSVIFYGEATDEELADLYKNALALIMPSRMEGFGLPVLEAMAHKCLVLVSDIPVFREICGDAAFYFDQNNSKAIKETLLNVCVGTNHTFNKKIEEGFQRTKIFSWEKMARETLSVYESSISI